MEGKGEKKDLFHPEGNSHPLWCSFHLMAQPTPPDTTQGAFITSQAFFCPRQTLLSLEILL